ncbi:MAG: type II toxin-antitoxin system VapC family toxin [Candidatus Asgardarchaeia archaeon]
MIKIYFEPSALFKGYFPEEGSEVVEKVISALDGNNLCSFTSIWSLLEIARAFKKRVNLGEIDEKEGENAVIFFFTDIKKLVSEGRLVLLSIDTSLIMKSYKTLWKYNLYAADALHVTTYFENTLDYFFAVDRHFKKFEKIENLKLIDPLTEDGVAKVNELIRKAKNKTNE